MAGETPAARARRVLGEVLGPLATARGLTFVAIAVGALLRVDEYGHGRDPWKDEVALRRSVVGHPVFEFDRPLVEDQLAPPGFLAASRLVVRAFGDSFRALRAIPLAGSVAALFLTAAVARRALPPRAVPLATALVALSDPCIYYASEFKQYSTDMAIGLAAPLLAIRLGDAPPRAWRGAAWPALAGFAAAWFSQTSAFALAAGWAWYAWKAAASRDRRAAVGALAIGGAWASGILGCFLVSRRLLGPGRFMWEWWGFAFLPIPPGSAADAAAVALAFANATIVPVGVVTPLGPAGSAALAVVLFAAGALAMARGGRVGPLVVLTLPIALAMLASALHRYPFHGRLLLHLVPSFALPIAGGAEAIARRLGRPAPGLALGLIAAFLLAHPALEASFFLDIRRHRTFDSHGDYRNDLLDYLEGRGVRPAAVRRANGSGPVIGR